jgi:lysophospholipase L1-like esterase
LVIVRSPLSALYDALANLDRGTAKTPVQIVQIGDSHTANDGFSGRLRELFQARFGDGGRGMLPPGVPFRLYKPAQVEVTAQGWETVGSLRAANRGPFGIAGVRQHAAGPAVMTLRSTTPAGLGRVEIEVWGQKGGGSLDVAWDGGSPSSFSTDAGSAGPLFLSVPPGPKGAGLTLRARGNGPVDVLSWSTVQGGPGVAYSNLGTIGATIGVIGRWDPALVRAELARLHPALILIAFGTNEGFADSTDMASYPALYAARVEALHEAAPQAAVAIIGPPDGTRAAQGTDRICPPVEAGHMAWQIPPHLEPVRAAEQAFAASHGYFYWDWSQAMGGACSLTRWALTAPPMAAADHVHLLRPGYRATAELLFDALMRDYQAHAGPVGRKSEAPSAISMAAAHQQSWPVERP